MLVEQEHEEGLLAGYSDNYVRVRFPGDDSLINQIVPVTVTAAAELCSRGAEGGFYPLNANKYHRGGESMAECIFAGLLPAKFQLTLFKTRTSGFQRY